MKYLLAAVCIGSFAIGVVSAVTMPINKPHAIMIQGMIGGISKMTNVADCINTGRKIIILEHDRDPNSKFGVSCIDGGSFVGSIDWNSVK